MIRKIKTSAIKIKDTTVSLLLRVCKNIKQLSVLSARKITESTQRFVSFIGKYAFVFSVFSVIGVAMFFVRRVMYRS